MLKPRLNNQLVSILRAQNKSSWRQFRGDLRCSGSVPSEEPEQEDLGGLDCEAGPWNHKAKRCNGDLAK